MTTPAPLAVRAVDAANSLSDGAIAGIVLGGFTAVVLLVWLYFLCTLANFYRMPAAQRPRNVFGADQNDCCTLMCINCNTSLLKQYCGFKNVDDIGLFHDVNQQEVALVTRSGDRFASTADEGSVLLAAPRYVSAHDPHY